jgi:hydrogenase nickel incorporation protein HypA/HybF
MHELPVTERILDVVLRHAAGHDVTRVTVIHLRIGGLSDLEDEWVQHYFDYLSRGTLAENARLAIKRSPIILCCEACNCSFEVQKTELPISNCPECGGSRCRLVAGSEYVVENMEVV